MWDCFSFKKKYFMFTHWTKRWSKCSIDSFILTHFNLDFLTIDQDLSLAFRAIYRAHGSVLMKYNSCHFIIIFIHCRVILHEIYVKISSQLMNLNDTPYPRVDNFSCCGFRGEKWNFLSGTGTLAHRIYISKNRLPTVPWKSSVVRL